MKPRMGHYNADISSGVDSMPRKPASTGSLISCPIIAAVNSFEAFEQALHSPTRAIYLLTGSPLTLPGMLQRAKDHGKLCLVNIDFLDGLARDRYAVEFLAKHEVDGIVSTRAEVLKAAQACNLITVQRTFGIDSAAVSAAKRMLAQFVPDLMEVLPAMAAPKIAKQLSAEYPTLGIMGGGLIENVKEIEELFAAGIQSVSVSDPRLWLI